MGKCRFTGDPSNRSLKGFPFMYVHVDQNGGKEADNWAAGAAN